jgi:hypothetical protein
MADAAREHGASAARVYVNVWACRALKRDAICHRTAMHYFHGVSVATDDPTGDRGLIMRGILLWAVGIPLPIIIILYLFHVI